MTLIIPSLDTVHNRLVADYQARFPLDDVSRHSDNWKRLRTMALGLLGLHHAADMTYADIFLGARTSSEGLDQWGVILGLPRKGATSARKSDALRVTGTAASAVAVGDELTHVNGLRYQVNEADTIPAGGSVDVDVVAIDTGILTRLDAGQILTFTSPPAGINSTAVLQLDLDEDGVDEEPDGDYLVRLLEKFGEPGQGGNAGDYRAWGLAVTGVATMYVWPLRRGRGAVDYAGLHDGTGSVRLLSAAERVTLAAAIDALRPVGHKSARVLEVTALELDVDMTITPRPGAENAMDWDDSTPLAVLAWTAGTRTLQFATNRPSDMLKGGRIVIDTDANDGTGEPFDIEALGAGADEVILKKTPGVAPVSPDVVYAGGPLTAPVRDALIEHFDSLGPAVGDDGTGEWDSDLDPQRLESVALGIDGVRTAITVTPSATTVATDPQFPIDTTIELLVPGQIVVRKA